LEGGFNVNSTSLNAWRSLLRSLRGVNVPSLTQSTASDQGTSFPGHLISLGAATTSALDASTDRFWRDYRQLSDSEIDALAAAIVAQVKKRAPFTGLADFVNRRLGSSESDQAFGGCLQGALDQATAVNDNGSSNSQFKMPDANAAASQYNYGAPYWGGPARTTVPQEYSVYQTSPQGSTRAEGADSASQITQANLLQQLAPVLVARGDTFTIRAYGEAHDAAGHRIAQAWCEAVVQRSPLPIKPDPASNGLNPLIEDNKTDWGRHYEIESFRWLSDAEI
jgi:hypothetical protein